MPAIDWRIIGIVGITLIFVVAALSLASVQLLRLRKGAPRHDPHNL